MQELQKGRVAGWSGMLEGWRVDDQLRRDVKCVPDIEMPGMMCFAVHDLLHCLLVWLVMQR